jgi:hypothetical protein
MIPKFGSVTLTWPQNLAHALHAKLTRTAADRIVILTGETETEVALREWPMPSPRGRQRGVRTRFLCAHCGASRDVIHLVDGVWCCRGKNCGNLSHACRHQQRYCPSIRRRERLLRKLKRTPPRGLRARILRAQIVREESMMVAHLKRVSRDLRKRSKRDERHDRGTE